MDSPKNIFFNFPKNSDFSKQNVKENYRFFETDQYNMGACGRDIFKSFEIIRLKHFRAIRIISEIECFIPVISEIERLETCFIHMNSCT